MVNPLWICVAILVLTCYGLFRRSRRRLYELAAKLPGPFDLPVIGSIHVGIGRGPTEIVEYLFQFRHKVPSMARGWVGPYLFVIVSEPEHIAKLLNSQVCVKKSYVYEFYRMQKGLFTAGPDHWRKLRKQLNPAFSVSTFRSFLPAFNEKAENLVKSLESSVGRGQFNVFTKIGNYALLTTVVNTLGLDLDDATDDYKEQHMENEERLFTIQYTRIYKAWLHLDFIYRLTDSYREEQERIVKFQELSRMVYEKRQKNRQENSNKSLTSDRDEHNIRQTHRFIDRLEQCAGSYLDEEGMIDNLDTFIFAANDTTTCVISATLLMLGMHPEVQERAYQEVMDVLPADGNIDCEDLSKLVYLEMVIKETMRLIPAAPVIARVNEADIQLGEYTIPANTQLVIPIMKVQRDKSIWGERSDKFDPENFSPEKCAKRHPYAYLAFSGGIRNCIGIKYAYISMKIVLAKLLRNYKISTDQKLSDLKLLATIVIRVSGGYNISIERRDK